jgi:hypothetical protein
VFGAELGEGDFAGEALFFAFEFGDGVGLLGVFLGSGEGESFDEEFFLELEEGDIGTEVEGVVLLLFSCKGVEDGEALLRGFCFFELGVSGAFFFWLGWLFRDLGGGIFGFVSGLWFDRDSSLGIGWLLFGRLGGSRVLRRRLGCRVGVDGKSECCRIGLGVIFSLTRSLPRA